MEMEFRNRNNDLGACVPTTQEKMNRMQGISSSQAAPRINVLPHRPTTPHMPSSEEVEQTLSLMENEAMQQNEELLRIHSGLDKERVSRLLAMLR